MQVVETDLVSAVRRELEARVGSARYGLWLGPTMDLALNGSQAVVGVPNPFFQRWLAKHFEVEIQQAVRTVTGRSLQVLFKVQQVDGTRRDRGHVPPEAEQSAPADETLQVEPHHGVERRAPAGADHWAVLEDFVVGACNQLAHAAALAACRCPPPWHVLLLHGAVGVGKTHLIQAVCRRLAAEGRRRRIVYLTAEEFTSEFVTALRGGTMPSFRKRYRGVDVLAVDDLHFFADKQATQEEFLHTLDSLASRGRLVLLAADRAPGVLPFASEALVTRLQAGMTCPVEAPDASTGAAIVAAKAARMQLALPAEVRAWVAETFSGSVREIEGALNSLRAHRQLLGGALDLAEAQRLLAPLVRPATRAVSLKDVERAVCEVFGLEPRVLRSPVRQRHVSQPRMLAMYLARKHTRAAYSEIGEYFGGRNHSTVISAQKKVNHWLSEAGAVQVRHVRWRVEEALSALERALRAG